MARSRPDSYQRSSWPLDDPMIGSGVHQPGGPGLANLPTEVPVVLGRPVARRGPRSRGRHPVGHCGTATSSKALRRRSRRPADSRAPIRSVTSQHCELVERASRRPNCAHTPVATRPAGKNVSCMCNQGPRSKVGPNTGKQSVFARPRSRAKLHAPGQTVPDLLVRARALELSRRARSANL